MVIGKFHRLTQVDRLICGGIGVDFPLSGLCLTIDLPDDDHVRVVGVGNAFPEVLDVGLDVGAGDVVLLRVASDLVDGGLVGFPAHLTRHAFVGGHAHGHDLHSPVCVLQIDGVGRDKEVERVDGVESDLLVARVPEALDDRPTRHEGVVDPGQDLLLEVGLLADLIVEPVLGDLGVGVELLAHGDEAGHHVHAECLLQEERLELLDLGIDERPVHVGCLEPRLVLATQAVMPQFVPARLAQFPRLPLIDSLFDLTMQTIPLTVVHHMCQCLSADLTTYKRTLIAAFQRANLILHAFQKATAVFAECFHVLVHAFTASAAERQHHGIGPVR